MSELLLPCPFCGHKEPKYDNLGGYMICGAKRCAATGPSGVSADDEDSYEATERRARVGWNKRSNIPAEPPVMCEFPTCPNETVYEGWYRRRDPFLGTPSGHIVLIAFCESCKSHPHLCANEPKPEKKVGTP